MTKPPPLWSFHFHMKWSRCGFIQRISAQNAQSIRRSSSNTNNTCLSVVAHHHSARTWDNSPCRTSPPQQTGSIQLCSHAPSLYFGEGESRQGASDWLGLVVVQCCSASVITQEGRRAVADSCPAQVNLDNLASRRYLRWRFILTVCGKEHWGDSYSVPTSQLTSPDISGLTKARSGVEVAWQNLE